MRTYVDDVNDQCSRLLADNVQLSPDATRQLDALNSRYKVLENAAGYHFDMFLVKQDIVQSNEFVRWRMH